MKKSRPNRSKRILGVNNPNWVSENEPHSTEYFALHIFIRHRLPKPSVCRMCNQPKLRYDLANISGKYLPELSDWEYLCHRCHMIKDGVIPNPNAPVIKQLKRPPHTEEAKAKMRAARLKAISEGRIHIWNKGKPWSAEMKQRISKTKQEKQKEWKEKAEIVNQLNKL